MKRVSTSRSTHARDAFAALNRRSRIPERPVLERPADAPPDTDVDLDRLVWDPEYREEMRAVLRAGA